MANDAYLYFVRVLKPFSVSDIFNVPCRSATFNSEKRHLKLAQAKLFS